jgi:hypothetical protein
VVVSIWQDAQCLATIRLAAADVPDLVRVLVAAAVAEPGQPRSAAS